MSNLEPDPPKPIDTEVSDFVRAYSADCADRIAFAWNGKHATEFQDANQDFRFRVVEFVCAQPGAASVELLAHLFRENSSWAREAWGAPRGLAELGAALLSRGGETALPDFLQGFTQSFDTFGACHQMTLDPVLIRRLLEVVSERAKLAPEGEQKLWESGRELFTKLATGTASKGWAVVQPGTPITNVRVVPQWRIKARSWLQKATGLFNPK